MNRKMVLIGLFLLLLLPVGYSNAAIFTENFNDATGTGLLSGDILASERWSLTNYYVGTIANDPQWTFSGQAFVAENGSSTTTPTDKAILLNEGPPHGSMATSAPISVTSGASYVLTFNHWGDNRPNTSPYAFTVFLNGVPLSTISRIYPASGPGVTETFTFTALNNVIFLSFTDITSSGQASAIIDNISISNVPIPPHSLAPWYRAGWNCWA